MSLQEDENRGNVIFLGVVKGRLRQRSTKEDPKANERIIYNKDGSEDKRVWERVYKSAIGLITKIEIRETNFGENLWVWVMDAGQTYILSMSFKSSYSTNLLKRLLSKTIEVKEGEEKKVVKLQNGIPFDHRIKFLPYHISDKDDPEDYNDGVVIYLENSTVPGDFSAKVLTRYTRANPEDFPQLEGDVHTKEDYDLVGIQRRKWLKGNIETLLAPAVKNNSDFEPPVVDNTETFEDDTGPVKNDEPKSFNNPDDNDLPF